MTRLSLLFVVMLVCTGCGAEPTEPTADAAAPGAITYHEDIKPLVDAYCVRCHVDGGVAPFPLTTYAEVAPVAELLAHAVETRTMPPFLAAPAVRPLNYDTSLSDAQIALFRAWVDAGAPAGDDAAPADPIELPMRALSRTDLTLQMPVAYTPTTVPDEYRCFVIDWPHDETRFITGVNVRPGNLAVAHHAVPYLIDPDYAGIVDEADGADGQPGYPCFGGATPPDTASFPTKIITGWAPGELGQDFPPGTGVRVLPGSRIVLQMHYSILAEGAQPDQSAVDFRLAEEVEHNAGNLPWLDMQWPSNPSSMLIPAGAESVTHAYEGDPAQSPLLGSFVPGLDPSEGIVLHSVLPHLHKLGKRITMDLIRADGTVEPLVHIARWDFDWQGYYEFAEPVTVQPGEKIRMECEWDNSAPNQPVIMGERRAPADVTWGEGTYDEMCAASIYVTGVSEGDPACADVGSVAADRGRFLVTFDAAPIRGNPNLDGELRGPIRGQVYRAEDVRLTGPIDGAQALGSFEFADIDLRETAAGPFPLDFDLPAGDYQFLGFLDVDGNAATTDGPDVNDPVMIPAVATTLSCAEQPVTLSFPILLPDL